MKIEINPRSLRNLKDICEVLYKLHPLVLNDLIGIERSLGKVLGFIDLSNMSMEERDFLSTFLENSKSITHEEEKKPVNKELEDYKNSHSFHELRKYIQINTDEYIPIKIYIEVEDPVIGRKVRELVEALEKTRAPEQFYLNKKEMDEDAYFAEGYGLKLNEEQLRCRNNFLDSENVEEVKEILRKEKISII